MNQRKLLGNAGEGLVVNYLKDRKFKIVERNFFCRLGEVDIIAKKEDLLVFVEVKTRKKAYFPISTVITPGKQRKIIATTKLFISKNDIYDKVCRFDVAIVVWDGEKHEIEYIEDAFWDSR